MGKNFRSLTWYLLPAEVVVLIFVLFYHPRLAYVNGLEKKDLPTSKFEEIEIGMEELRVLAIMGNEPDEIGPWPRERRYTWVEQNKKITIQFAVWRVVWKTIQPVNANKTLTSN
jgi:hypothetical protein